MNLCPNGFQHLAHLHQGAEVVADRNDSLRLLSVGVSEDDHHQAAGALYLETLSELSLCTSLAVAWTPRGEKASCHKWPSRLCTSSAFKKWLEDQRIFKIAQILKRDSILLDARPLAGVSLRRGLGGLSG